MKKSIYLFALLFSASFIFTACDDNGNGNGNGNGNEPNPTVPVTGVTLNSNVLTLAIDDNERLTATVAPANATNRAVRWTSDDEDVATVNANGVVTAVSLGTANITVTTVDGEKTANAVVTVTLPANQVDVGVEINGIVWATRNVDAPGTFAENPESQGMFFQWNSSIGWSSTNPMVDSNGRTTWDNFTPAGTAWYAENDPCPQGWRVPSADELRSLHDSGHEWVSNWDDTDINGRVFGTYPNQIFLPAAGSRITDGTLNAVDAGGGYWSSTQFNSTRAINLWFSNISSGVSDLRRVYGFSVRCVAE